MCLECALILTMYRGVFDKLFCQVLLVLLESWETLEMVFVMKWLSVVERVIIVRVSKFL